VAKVCDSDSGYMPDRAHRLLVAAINDAPAEPISPEQAVLYERERELGWRPLQDAFAELCDAVPELFQIVERAKASPQNHLFSRGPRVLRHLRSLACALMLSEDGAEAAGEAPLPTAIGLAFWCELVPVSAESSRLARGVGLSPRLPDVGRCRSSASAKPSGDRALGGLHVRRRLGRCGRAG
jgi:hypothetical protein